MYRNKKKRIFFDDQFDEQQKLYSRAFFRVYGILILLHESRTSVNHIYYEYEYRLTDSHSKLCMNVCLLCRLRDGYSTLRPTAFTKPDRSTLQSERVKKRVGKRAKARMIERDTKRIKKFIINNRNKYDMNILFNVTRIKINNFK